MGMFVMNKHVFITRPKIQNIYNWLYSTVVQRTCDNVPQATGSAGTKHQTLLRAQVYVCLQQTCDNVTQVTQTTTGSPVPNTKSSTCITLYQ